VKFQFRCVIALVATLPLVSAVSMSAAKLEDTLLELAADSSWKFFLGDLSGAETPSFADTSWRSVNLPHDWSIESRPEKENPSGAGGGYFPGGVG